MIVDQLSEQLLNVLCNPVPAAPMHWGNTELHKAFCCFRCLWLLLNCRRVYRTRLSMIVDWLHTQLLDALCNPVPAELLLWGDIKLCEAICCPYCACRMLCRRRVSWMQPPMIVEQVPPQLLNAS